MKITNDHNRICVCWKPPALPVRFGIRGPIIFFFRMSVEREDIALRTIDFLERRGVATVAAEHLFGYISNSSGMRAQVGGNARAMLNYFIENMGDYFRVNGNHISPVLEVPKLRHLVNTNIAANEAAAFAVDGDNLKQEIYDVCMDAYARKAVSELSYRSLFGCFSLLPELRQAFGKNDTGLLSYLKEHFSDKFTFRGEMVVSKDMVKYLKEKERQISATKTVLSLPDEAKSKRQLEDEALEKMLANDVEIKFDAGLEEKATHFFLAIFKGLGDPQFIPISAAYEYLQLCLDKSLLDYVGPSKKKTRKFFVERSHVFIVTDQLLSLQPPHIRKTLLLLNQHIYKKSCKSGGRSFDEVKTLWQFSKRIDDAARKDLGPTDDDLKRVIKAHPWIFREGFNFANITCFHQLPEVVDGKVSSVELPFPLDRANIDHQVEQLKVKKTQSGALANQNVPGESAPAPLFKKTNRTEPTDSNVANVAVSSGFASIATGASFSGFRDLIQAQAGHDRRDPDADRSVGLARVVANGVNRPEDYPKLAAANVKVEEPRSKIPAASDLPLASPSKSSPFSAIAKTIVASQGVVDTAHPPVSSDRPPGLSSPECNGLAASRLANDSFSTPNRSSGPSIGVGGQLTDKACQAGGDAVGGDGRDRSDAITQTVKTSDELILDLLTTNQRLSVLSKYVTPK